MKKKNGSKKKGVRYWHGKLWTVYSRYIRLRDSLEYGKRNPRLNEIGSSCISCHKFYPIKKMQAGHFITRSDTNILYNEYNVHAQCYNCNINLRGNWTGYLEEMVARYGQDTVDQLLAERKLTRKFTPMELEDMFNSYSLKAKELEKQLGKIW